YSVVLYIRPHPYLFIHRENPAPTNNVVTFAIFYYAYTVYLVNNTTAEGKPLVTIKDIAKRAGVSFSTVSKALQDRPLVKPATRSPVLAIAQWTGYQPQMAARGLVSKRTGAIGIVWPSIKRGALSSMVSSVHEKLEEEGYTVLLSMSHTESAIRTFRRF